MKIAFWSPTPFAGRKSTHLLLFALQTILLEGGEQLVLHTDAEGSGPEHFLLSGSKRNRMMEKKEFGVELLAKVLHCERGSKEAIVNASYTFAEGRLHILPSGSKRFYQEKEAAEEVHTIIRYAEKEFKNVWIELPAGNSEFASKVLEAVDCVVVNLAQSPWEIGIIEELPRFQNVFFVFGAFEQRNIYTVNNLKLLFPELRGRCAAIPYDEELLAACCKGELEKVWIRESGKRETGDAADFYRGTERAFLRWKEGHKNEVVESVTGKERNGESLNRYER